MFNKIKINCFFVSKGLIGSLRFARYPVTGIRTDDYGRTRQEGNLENYVLIFTATAVAPSLASDFVAIEWIIINV